ncbi:MAG: General stress protein 69 [Firmicutes bacterium]|nr:General stress protein 69 [Bacillota bacterium]
MQYRPFGQLGFKISTLGLGCMRLPLKQATEGAHGNVLAETMVDEAASIDLIRGAVDAKVNYIDTAYDYHKGKSELLVGQALSGAGDYRKKVKLATKLPPWHIKEAKDFNRVLDEQLKKLNTSYVDFYLLHALHKATWEKMKSLGALDFLNTAMRDGRIKYPAFSIHDSFAVFKDILDSYDWAMCQIQLNYMNEDYQAGMEGFQYAAHRNVPIVIMEPLLGGKLAKEPPAEIKAVWNKAAKKKKPVEWALRWVSNFPETTVVLSGMSTIAQLNENIHIINKAPAGNLSLDELGLIDRVKQLYRARAAIDCTECGYCLPCPEKVNIPHVFSLYNDFSTYGTVEGAFTTYKSLKKSMTDASRCVECGQCEPRCPQGIKIISALKQAHLTLQAD